jgi:hypothetical protein
MAIVDDFGTDSWSLDLTSELRNVRGVVLEFGSSRAEWPVFAGEHDEANRSSALLFIDHPDNLEAPAIERLGEIGPRRRLAARRTGPGRSSPGPARRAPMHPPGLRLTIPRLNRRSLSALELETRW